MCPVSDSIGPSLSGFLSQLNTNYIQCMFHILKTSCCFTDLSDHWNPVGPIITCDFILLKRGCAKSRVKSTGNPTQIQRTDSLENIEKVLQCMQRLVLVQNQVRTPKVSMRMSFKMAALRWVFSLHHVDFDLKQLQGSVPLWVDYTSTAKGRWFRLYLFTKAL